MTSFRAYNLSENEIPKEYRSLWLKVLNESVDALSEEEWLIYRDNVLSILKYNQQQRSNYWKFNPYPAQLEMFRDHEMGFNIEN